MPQRDTDRRRYQRRETVNPNRLRSLTIGPRTFAIEVVENDEGPPSFMLQVSPKALKMMDMTVWTTTEVDAFQRWIIEACEEARGITRQLDAEAEAAAAAGDLTHKRLYRAEPVEHRYKELGDIHDTSLADDNRDLPPGSGGERSESGDDPGVPS